jgi:hypothetical protein
MPAQPAAHEPVAATEAWFVKHGLPYFVPAQRRAAREALQPRRTVPLVVAVGLTAVGAAVLLGLLFEDLSMGTAALTFVGITAALAYAVTALRARPIVTWALHRTLGSLRQLLPTVTRALPLLIVFVTFLFINGEVWHVSSRLDGGVLWLVVLLFLTMGVGFFLVRLPEQIDRADDDLDDARICELVGEPALAAEARRVAERRPGLLLEQTGISRFERLNLTVALVVIQLSQVLLVSLSLLLFLLLFGSLAMQRGVVEDWIGQSTTHVPGLPNVSVELLQVSVFLAAFSALYISVAAVTDETYRSHFFTGVMRELERAIATRAAYNALRADRGDTLEDDPSATPVEPLGRSDAGVDAPTVPLQPVTPERRPQDARPE